MIAAFQLLYTSDSTPIGGLTSLVSYAIVAGAALGIVCALYLLIASANRRALIARVTQLETQIAELRAHALGAPPVAGPSE